MRSENTGDECKIYDEIATKHKNMGPKCQS